MFMVSMRDDQGDNTCCIKRSHKTFLIIVEYALLSGKNDCDSSAWPQRGIGANEGKTCRAPGLLAESALRGSRAVFIPRKAGLQEQ